MNPSPVSSKLPEPDQRAAEQERVALLKGIVLGWEKLRLIYNGVLLLPGLIVCVIYFRESLWRVWEGFATRLQLVVEIGIGALIFGLAANICYCLGPYTECLVAAAGFPVTGRKVRPFLFGVGLLMSFFPIVFLILLDAI